VWAGAFAGTSVAYLALANAEAVADGGGLSAAPWLHTYALPVFAVLAVLVAAAWRLFGWVHEVEQYAHRAIARVRRILTAPVPFRAHHPRAGDVLAPRRRFGLSFECRPPPQPA
jgi:hypothetical protein